MMTNEMLAETYMKNQWPHYEPDSITYHIYYSIYMDGLHLSDGKDKENE